MVREVSIVVVSVGLLFGCGGSAGAPDAAVSRPTCDEIMEQCHPFDLGTGEIHECHELSEAETTTEAECVAQRSHCFEVCVASDAGAATDGAVGDAGSPSDGGVADDAGDHSHPDGAAH